LVLLNFRRKFILKISSLSSTVKTAQSEHDYLARNPMEYLLGAKHRLQFIASATEASCIRSGYAETFITVCSSRRGASCTCVPYTFPRPYGLTISLR